MKSPHLEGSLNFDTCFRAGFERLTVRHAASSRPPEGYVGERGMSVPTNETEMCILKPDGENADQSEATTCQRERMPFSGPS